MPRPPPKPPRHPRTPKINHTSSQVVAPWTLGPRPSPRPPQADRPTRPKPCKCTPRASRRTHPSGASGTLDSGTLGSTGSTLHATVPARPALAKASPVALRTPLPGPYLRSSGAGRPRAGRRWSPRRHRKCPGPGPTRPLRLLGGLAANTTSFGRRLAAAAEEIVRVRPQVVQVVGNDLNRTPDAGEYGHTDGRAAESAAESFSLGSVGRLIG